jgi:hypothetical protein
VRLSSTTSLGHELSHKHSRHVYEPMHDRRLMSASDGMPGRRMGAVSSRRIDRVRPLMSVVEGIIAVVSAKENQRGEEKWRGESKLMTMLELDMQL